MSHEGEMLKEERKIRSLLLKTLLIMSHITDETMEAKANGDVKQQAVKEENKK